MMPLLPAPSPSARARLRVWVSAVVLLLAAQAAVASPLVSEELQLVNFLVGDHGQHRDTRRMVLDPVLTAVARSRAADMARRRYFAHVNPDGFGPNYLARAAGYDLPSSWGRSRSDNCIESIGAGYTTPAAAWDGWMHSSAHRTHLLAQSAFYRDQTNFGVGFYADPSSPYRRYWVIITAPPASRETTAFASRRTGKSPRVGTAMPVWSNVDPDFGEVADTVTESAPRPTATRTPVLEKLWNWTDIGTAPRPPARWNVSAE